jgi:hypothetical protein
LLNVFLKQRAYLFYKPRFKVKEKSSVGDGRPSKFAKVEAKDGRERKRVDILFNFAQI